MATIGVEIGMLNEVELTHYPPCIFHTIRAILALDGFDSKCRSFLETVEAYLNNRWKCVDVEE